MAHTRPDAIRRRSRSEIMSSSEVTLLFAGVAALHSRASGLGSGRPAAHLPCPTDFVQVTGQGVASCRVRLISVSTKDKTCQPADSQHQWSGWLQLQLPSAPVTAAPTPGTPVRTLPSRCLCCLGQRPLAAPVSPRELSLGRWLMFLGGGDRPECAPQRKRESLSPWSSVGHHVVQGHPWTG